MSYSDGEWVRDLVDSELGVCTYIHPSCMGGVHTGVDIFTHPRVGLVANDCPVCWPDEDDAPTT